MSKHPTPPKTPPPGQGPPGGPPGRPPDKPDKPVKIEVTIGAVKVTVEGPALEVAAFIEWLRRQEENPDAIIYALKVVFGPETTVRNG